MNPSTQPKGGDEPCAAPAETQSILTAHSTAASKGPQTSNPDAGLTVKMFPILKTGRWGKTVLPASIPWSLVAPHEAYAQKYHSQSLERLAQRGGLAPEELWHVILHKDWDGSSKYNVSEEEALEWLQKLLQEAQP